MTWKHVSPLLKLMIAGAFIVGFLFALLGIWLVYLGATGATELSFFGQTFKSANVGVVAIFPGAALIVLVLRSAMKVLPHTITHRQ